MKSYSLIPNQRTNLKKRVYRYLESDATNNARALNLLKIQTFKIDWDRIQKEMGVEISPENRMLYQNAYRERSFNVAGMLEMVEGVIGLVGFTGTLLTGLFKLVALNHAIFILAVVVITVLMLARAIHSSSHKLNYLDPIIVDKIANQMRDGNFNPNEIKYVWVESYQTVSNKYISSPWGTFVINLLGMIAMSFVASLALTGLVN